MTYTALGAIVCWSKDISDAHKPIEEDTSNQQIEVIASNSLLQNRSKYLEARSEFLFRISGLHIGAHHGNVVPL
jgi:hypothetical protein